MPEVETIRRVIGPQIQGIVINKVTVKRPEVVAYPAADELINLRKIILILNIVHKTKWSILKKLIKFFPMFTKN